MRVVVVGAGISGLTAAYLARMRGHDVVCVDPARTAGGLIQSERHDGFLCELGPQALLDGTSDTTELLASLGLRSRAIASHAAAGRRFIYARGRLHPVPDRPTALVRSSLLTPAGKLRLLAEPFVRARRVAPGDDTETVGEFGARRLGIQAARALLAPAVIGVYATDASQLSMSSAFPRLAAMEREHGSLFRGMLALRRRGARGRERRRKAWQAQPSPPLPRQRDRRRGGAGRALSFPDGLGELPAALETALGPGARLRARVNRIQPVADRPGLAGGRGWRVTLNPHNQTDDALHAEFRTITGPAPAAAAAADSTLEADAVVLAVGADVTADLLGPLLPDLRASLGDMPLAPIVVCCLGFRDASAQSMGMDLDAYGFLVARGEGPRLLGCQYESSTFPGRAPRGGVLLRALLGGVGTGDSAALFEPQIVDRSDDEIAARALADLGTVAGLRCRPDLVRVWRYPRGIPLYLPGHAARIAALDARLDSTRACSCWAMASGGGGQREHPRGGRPRSPHFVAVALAVVLRTLGHRGSPTILRWDIVKDGDTDL